MAKRFCKEVCGVYGWRNRQTGKWYIGSSVRILGRKTNHLSLLRKGKHHSYQLQKSFNKWSEANFDFVHLLCCPLEDLEIYEDMLIEFYQSYTRGYNVLPKAGSLKNHKLSDKTREKMSKTHKERGTGRHERTPEMRMNMSIAQKNKSYRASPEHRAKMSDRMSGDKNPAKSERSRINISKALLGTTKSDSHKAALAEAWKIRRLTPISEETKLRCKLERIDNPRTHSIVTKLRMKINGKLQKFKPLNDLRVLDLKNRAALVESEAEILLLVTESYALYETLVTTLANIFPVCADF